MVDLLDWALDGARRQTLRLVEGIPGAAACAQAFTGEHHPVWTIGHLLLGDSYLLLLLEADELPADFDVLLDRYGPRSRAEGSVDRYDPLDHLVARLTDTGLRRRAALARFSADDFHRPTADLVLARSQPTIGHHVQALILHEGYHAGRLSAWRHRQGMSPVGWTFAPPPDAGVA